jgi:hypothetical protein
LGHPESSRLAKSKSSSAKAFVRRFHPIAGERCGDQELATYLVQINAMTREFLRIDAES